MTCRIYILRFKGTDQVYIGQSNNIEKRTTAHIYKMHSGTASIKLQQAYTAYGEPIYEVLSECSKEELDLFETETIEIFNSYHNGLNSRDDATVGNSLQGQLHPNAIFSNEQVIDVFNYIIDRADLN